MRIKTAVLTTLLLGASSAAFAQPRAENFSQQRFSQVRDHRSRFDERRNVYTPTYSRWSYSEQPSDVQQLTYSQQRTYSQRPYGYQVDASFNGGYGVRTYAYGANPDQANIARDEWLLLADNVSLDGHSASVGLDGRRFDAIELQATRGGSFVETVLVDLVDGRRLTITPSRPLDVEHAPNLRIDLGRGVKCGVRAVTVIGQSNGWSAFRVIGG